MYKALTNMDKTYNKEIDKCTCFDEKMTMILIDCSCN